MEEGAHLYLDLLIKLGVMSDWLNLVHKLGEAGRQSVW